MAVALVLEEALVRRQTPDTVADLSDHYRDNHSNQQLSSTLYRKLFRDEAEVLQRNLLREMHRTGIRLKALMRSAAGLQLQIRRRIFSLKTSLE